MIQVLFVIIAALGLAAALGTVLARNLVHAALFLIAFFFTVACQFVLLEAEFLAALQVLVYIGAVAILLMFGIMLTRNIQGDDPTSTPSAWQAARADRRAGRVRWCWPSGSASRRAIGSQNSWSTMDDAAQHRPERRTGRLAARPQAVNNMAKVVGRRADDPLRDRLRSGRPAADRRPGRRDRARPSRGGRAGAARGSHGDRARRAGCARRAAGLRRRRTTVAPRRRRRPSRIDRVGRSGSEPDVHVECTIDEA